jgi:sugar phosphate isomerase/epimerase
MIANKIFGRSLNFCAIILFSSFVFWTCSTAKKINSRKTEGVKLGAITYSWRSMSWEAKEILKFCKETGITSLEMMGSVAEDYAGIPPQPPRLRRGEAITMEEQKSYRVNLARANEARRIWRIGASMNKFKELRQMFNDAGVDIHIVKFAPARWTDEEIDYAFEAAKALGAKGITNEIGLEAAKKLGPFAEKHNLYAIFHNHAQPGEPGFNFDDYLDLSPMNMLNFDVGHYVGATGKHPNEIIEKYHDRIVSLHLKDKTSKNSDPPNTNKFWGTGDTPIADILQLIQINKWPIHCDVELEYQVPEDSDAIKETKKCVAFCKKALE